MADAAVDFTTTPRGLTGKVLERAGCPIHYWTGGPDGRPLVVFMHGATMDHRMFNAQVEALLPDYRVLVWDCRGQGASQPMGDGFSLAMCAADMLAILDREGEESAVFVGQSLGGYVAQHIVRSTPERVLALVIIGATPLAKAYSKLDVWALKASLPLFRLWPFGNLTTVVARNTARTPAAQAYALEAIRRTSRANFITIWEDVSTAVDERGLPGFTIDVPLLLLHGDRDTAGTIRRDMPVWATQEPRAEYHVIAGAGHNANQDNPAETNRILRAFLEREVG